LRQVVTATGKVTEYKSGETFGVFVFAGYAPATEAVKGLVERNEQGYIVTDAAQKTSAEGVYAAAAQKGLEIGKNVGVFALGGQKNPQNTPKNFLIKHKRPSPA
jgi:thioredoxin reductase